MKTEFLLSRLLAVLLCLCMALSMAACGGGSSASSDVEGTTSGEPSSTTTTIVSSSSTSVAGESTTATAQPGESTTAAGTVTTSQTTTTTRHENKPVQTPLAMTDYIRNPQVMKPRYLSDTKGFEHIEKEGFFVDPEYDRHKNNLSASVREVNRLSLERYGFYTKINEAVDVGEWGWNFTQLMPGKTTGDGRVLLEDVHYSKEKPNTRADALRIIKTWLFKQYKDKIVDTNGFWSSMNGHYLWNHYAGEWGADLISSETGETIAHSQASIAFTRGAGRQYGVPTHIDFSEWFYGKIKEHSPSLVERTGMAVYMGGISFYLAEAGCWNVFQSGKMDGDYYVLNQVGRAYQSVIDFSEKYPDIGANYTPFGIVMDYYHGIKANEELSHPFGYVGFKQTAADDMTVDLIDKFFPNGWKRSRDESTYLVNGPYGDTCDTLLQNASQEVLNSYPCLILTGDIKLSGEEKNRYINYVKQGGTLVLNTAYLPQFVSYKNQYGNGTGVKEFTDGKGSVIVYGPDFSLDAIDGIIKDQLKKLVPFTISEQVEYLINVKDGTLLVTLINNDGYTKVTGGIPKMDKTKTKEVTVTYTGDLTPKCIKEIYQGAKITVSGKAATITVIPGETRVLEFKFN